MNTVFITFKQLMHDYHNVLDENIQRKFEWNEEKIRTFCDVLSCSASDFIENPKEADCKRDMGNIHRFEIPSDNPDYNPKKHSYYTDDGGHRLLELALTTKALYDIIKENNNVVDVIHEIVSEDTMAYLNGLIKDIKQNFVPKRDIRAFNYIMDINKNVTLKKNEQKICESFEQTKTFYIELLNDDIETFRDVCTFLVEDLGFVAQNYPPTSMSYRREKYNAINNVVQPQEKIHRMASTLAEVAEKYGCDDFLIKHNEAYTLLEQEYKINPTEGIEAYYYIKLSECVLPEVNIESSVGTKKLCSKAATNKLGDFNFYNTFFDDIRIYGSLRGKKFNWNATDTKENRHFALLTASLVDVFTYAKTARMATTAYYFHILKNCFNISNNCLINSVKEGVNKKKLNELLSYIFIYKLCITSRCDNNVASDERSVYFPLLKTMAKILTDESVMDKHIARFKQMATKSIETPAYQYISTSGWSYKSKSTRFALCLVSMNGRSVDECFRDAATKFFDFNGYDIDHIIALLRGKNKTDDMDDSWKNNFANLRIDKKVENRADNKSNGENRYIGVDSSFPSSMYNKVFDESCLKERSEWIIKKIHFIVDEILKNVNGNKCDVSEQITELCVAY